MGTTVVAWSRRSWGFAAVRFFAKVKRTLRQARRDPQVPHLDANAEGLAHLLRVPLPERRAPVVDLEHRYAALTLAIEKELVSLGELKKLAVANAVTGQIKV